MQLDIHDVRAFNDVKVGDYVPRFIPYEARARALRHARSPKRIEATCSVVM